MREADRLAPSGSVLLKTVNELWLPIWEQKLKRSYGELKNIRLEVRLTPAKNGMDNGVSVNVLGDMGNRTVTLTHTFRFYLGFMPSCCGLGLFHTFSYDPSISKESFHQVMDLVMVWLESLQNDKGYYLFVHDRRVEFITVSRPDHEERQLDRTSGDLPGPDNQVLYYPYFFAWFKERRTIQDVHTFFNENSGNLCHRVCALL